MSTPAHTLDDAEEAAALAKLERAAAQRDPAPPPTPNVFATPVEALIERAQALRERWDWAPAPEPRERPRLLNVPSKHAWCLTATAKELATGCDPNAVKAAIEGAAKSLHCVMLYGPQRSGKSNLATWLAAKACARRNKPGFWIKAETLGGLCHFSSSVPPEFERAQRIPVLVLDDLGTESRNEETRAMITRLLTEREAEAHLVTIVTHGLLPMPGELNARYAAAVSGRYTDASTSLCIAVNNAWNVTKAKVERG